MLLDSPPASMLMLHIIAMLKKKGGKLAMIQTFSENKRKMFGIEAKGVLQTELCPALLIR